MKNLGTRLSEIERRWPNLMARIHDPALFEDVTQDEAVRWFSYFFSLPKHEKGRPSLRSHVIALYDPFAKRSHFPAGLRFSCNTYVGCALQCAYCYIQSYRDYPGMAPYAKRHFPERLRKDFAELDALGLPVAPLHFSNSTDALQEKLESEHGNTLHLLRCLAEGEHERFAPIRLLTRNPTRLAREAYCEALCYLREKIIVQVSIPILDTAAGRVYEPGVPSAADRWRAIYALRQRGIPVSLRIDPLFPRDPLPPRIFLNKQLSDFGLSPAQTESDLRYLVTMAAQCGCVSIIVSALKIPKQLSPRSQMVMKEWIALYRWLGEHDPRLSSRNFYRLPHVYQHKELIAPILEEAANHGIPVEHCKANLVEAKAPKPGGENA